MRKIRVALIEDDELTRLSLRTALGGYPDIAWVGETANGIDGLQLLREQQPDVAIVDIGLPDIDGIELTKRYKSSLPPHETKILILTLYDREEEVLAAFTAGADSYCMKDIRLELLLEALRATYQGNAWIDPAIARIILARANVSPSYTLQTLNLPDVSPLTERELEVLQLIVNGNSNAAISEKLYITVGTVKTHVRNILNKLCADDRTQAAVLALRSGLVG